jgi:hypothetical protein
MPDPDYPDVLAELTEILELMTHGQSQIVDGLRTTGVVGTTHRDHEEPTRTEIPIRTETAEISIRTETRVAIEAPASAISAGTSPRREWPDDASAQPAGEALASARDYDYFAELEQKLEEVRARP